MSKNSTVMRKKKKDKKKKKKERIKSRFEENSKPPITHTADKEFIENRQSKKNQKVVPHKIIELSDKKEKNLTPEEVKHEIKDTKKQVEEKIVVEISEDENMEDTIQIPSTEELYRQKKSTLLLNIKLKIIEDLVLIPSLINELPKFERKKIREFDQKLKVKTREIPELKIKTSLEKSYLKEILKTLINRKSENKEQGSSATEKKLEQKEREKPKDSKASGNPPEEKTVESIFEKIFKTEESNFPSDIDTDNPYVIFLPTSEEDKYIDSLWIILREIFQKYTKKGKPISKQHDKKDYLEDELEADDRIALIEERGEDFIFCLPKKDKIHGINDINQKVNMNLLKNRLRELKSQGFGFIIFHLPEESIRKIKSEIEKEDWHPNAIYIEPQLFKELQEQDLELVLEIEKPDSLLKKSDTLKKNIACSFWGLIEPTNDDRWKENKNFDALFCACEKKFNEKLRDIYKQTFITENNNKVILKNHLRVKLYNSEGKSHKRIKILVLKDLLENREKQFENIKIEEELPSTKIHPDITVIDEEVYEIETFYGRGDPEERIVELIKKYQEYSYKGKLNIVIMNLDAILWYKEFVGIKNNKKKENIDIEFLTLDLKNETLISIKELANHIKNSFRTLK